MKKKIIFKKMIFLAVLFFSISNLSAATFTAWGYKILDGDSIVVVYNKKTLYIELDGIDCPELEQEYGKEAADFTTSFIYKKKVSVDIRNYDEEDRIIGRLSEAGKDLSLALVEEGLAWYAKEDSSDKDLAKAQKKAKKEKKGLWKQSKPTPPWIYREIQEKLTKKQEENGEKQQKK